MSVIRWERGNTGTDTQQEWRIAWTKGMSYSFNNHWNVDVAIGIEGLRQLQESKTVLTCPCTTANMLPPGSPGIFSAAGNALCQSAQGEPVQLDRTTLQRYQRWQWEFPRWSMIFPFEAFLFGDFPGFPPRYWGYAWCTLIESWSFTQTSRYVASISTGAQLERSIARGMGYWSCL